MKTRIIAASALLIALLLTACSSEQTKTPADEQSAENPVITETVTEEASTELYPDDLPEADFGGYTFRILADNDYIGYVYAAEQTGSLINDVLYESNNAVAERCNITFEQIVQDTWTNTDVVKKMILSGDDSFDTGFIHDISAGNLSMERLFYNLYDVPHLNFTQPWWPKYTVDSLTLNGQMYLISNYISYYGFHSTRTIFFNRTLIENYDLPSPYELVRNNEWTLDKLIELSKDVYADKNGDGKRDYDDLYGFAMTVPYCLFENFGFEAWGKSEDGTSLYLDTYSEKTVELMEKLCGWLVSDKEGTLYSNTHSDRYAYDSSNTMFANGNVLFTYGAIGHLMKGLISTDTSYGIVPMPKMTADQDHYICACTELPGIIPTTASDIDRTGYIIEAMSAESYRRVIPSYYEFALKGRYADDPDSVEMLDIMFQNRVLSFSYIYGGGGNCFQQVVNNVLTQKGNFASYYEKNAAREQKRIDTVNEFFSDKG